MVSVVDMPVKTFVNKTGKAECEEFSRELAKGYFEYEIMEKQKQLKEFSKAYNDITDKDSFNAQYLEVLIHNAREELKLR
jgi:hypothetical protein